MELIVSDDNGGIRDAVAMLWPNAKHQLCVFHFLKNFDKKTESLRPKLREQIKKDIRGLFKAKDKREFEQRLMAFMRNYKQIQEHKAIKYMLEHIEDITQFYSMPKCMQAIARTTNRLERTFGKIRRRVKIFGRFANSNSCRRWLFALIAEGLLPNFKGVSHA